MNWTSPKAALILAVIGTIVIVAIRFLFFALVLPDGQTRPRSLWAGIFDGLGQARQEIDSAYQDFRSRMETLGPDPADELTKPAAELDMQVKNKILAELNERTVAALPPEIRESVNSVPAGWFATLNALEGGGPSGRLVVIEAYKTSACSVCLEAERCIEVRSNVRLELYPASTTPQLAQALEAQPDNDNDSVCRKRIFTQTTAYTLVDDCFNDLRCPGDDAIFNHFANYFETIP